jgi:hypothetical protein
MILNIRISQYTRNAHNLNETIFFSTVYIKKKTNLPGQAIANNPGFVELRRIDVAKEVATTLSKSQNRMLLSSDSLLLNVMSSVGTEQKMATKGTHDAHGNVDAAFAGA